MKRLNKYAILGLLALSSTVAFISCDSDATSGIYSQMYNATDSQSYTIVQMTGDPNKGFVLALESDGIYKITKNSSDVSTPTQTLLVKGYITNDDDDIYRITAIYSSNGTDLYYILNGSDADDDPVLYRVDDVDSSTIDPDLASDPTASGATAITNEIGVNVTPRGFTDNGYLYGSYNGTSDDDNDNAQFALVSMDNAITSSNTIDWTSDGTIIDLNDNYGLSSVIPVLSTTNASSETITGDSDPYSTNTPLVVSVANISRGDSDKYYYDYYVFDGNLKQLVHYATEYQYDVASVVETTDSTASDSTAPDPRLIGIFTNGYLLSMKTSSNTINKSPIDDDYDYTAGNRKAMLLIDDDDSSYNLIMMNEYDYIYYYSFDGAYTTDGDDFDIDNISSGWADDISSSDEISGIIKTDTTGGYLVSTSNYGFYTIDIDDPNSDSSSNGSSTEGFDY